MFVIVIPKISFLRFSLPSTSSFFLFWGILFSCFFFLRCPAFAVQSFSLTEEEKAYIQSSKPIEVSYDAFWPPFEKFDQDNQTIQGINFEILMLISELTGLKFEFLHGLTYADALEKLCNGQISMHLSYDTNPEKAKELNAVLSDTFLTTPIAMVGRKYQLTEKSVLAVSKLHPVVVTFVKETFPDNVVIEFDDIHAAYEAVEAGEADYTFENVYAARTAISEGGYPLLHIANLLPLYDKFSFIFNKNVDPRLISIFNKAIATFPQDKFTNILLKHIMTPSYKSQFVQFLSYISVNLLIGIIVLLLALIVFLFIYTKKQQTMKKVLERKQKQVQGMLDAFPMPIYISDIETYEILYFNKAVSKFFGCEDINSKKCYNVFRNLDSPCKNCSNEIIKDLSEPYVWNRYDEEIKNHLQFVDSCISWDDKEKVRLSIISDITEILELEKGKLEQELNTIVSENIPLGITFWNKDGEIVDCNAEVLRIFGFNTKEEYIENFHLLSPNYQPDGRNSKETVEKNHINVLEKGFCRFEWLHNDIDGELIPMEIIHVSTKLAGEDIIITYAKDLREIKHAQIQLKEAELRNTLILDSMPMGVNFWDDANNLIYTNLESATLFGFETKEDFMQNFHIIHPEFQPDGRTSQEVVQQQIADGHTYGTCKSEMMCKHIITGEEIPVEIFMVRTYYQGKNGLIIYFRDMRDHHAMLKEIAGNEKKLRAAKELAEQSTKAKGEFLANMSHEVRTPMNGILGLLHLLEQTPMTDVQVNYVNKISFSANNLMRIIDDILDFSKIEAGKLEMEEQPFTLQSISQEVIDLYGPRCIEKTLSLDVNVGNYATLVLLGDALRLKQVLFNLVSNAIKFTSIGTISLEIESVLESEQNLQCRFAVRDSGIGLTPEQMNRLFSAFSQADSTVTRKYGGTGLGLAISKNIISMMHGDIWVESEYGKGTTFFCTALFPLAPESLQNTLLESTTCSVAEERTLGLTKGHLLLAEDNEINQIVAQEILLSAGFTLDIAADGQEALNLLEKNHYDAVLMDIQMPIMDGYTATKQIRSQEKFACLPIIAMSAHAMKGDKEISLSHGMNDHITKPIDPKLLCKTLQFWLAQK